MKYVMSPLLFVALALIVGICSSAERTKAEHLADIERDGIQCKRQGKGLGTSEFVKCMEATRKSREDAETAVWYAYEVACKGEKPGTLALRQCVDYELYGRYRQMQTPTIPLRPPLMLDCINLGSGITSCTEMP